MGGLILLLYQVCNLMDSCGLSATMSMVPSLKKVHWKMGYKTCKNMRVRLLVRLVNSRIRSLCL